MTIPHIPIASPLIAPSTSPISIAFDVPTAWLDAPMASPAATGSDTLNNFIRRGANIPPSIHVPITAATVIGTTPPAGSDMLTAIGVVTDFGSKETVRLLSSPNNRHSP